MNNNITKNNTFIGKVIVASLVVLNVLFLIYWSILAYYSRLHYDDLHFLWKMREMSVFDYVKENKMNPDIFIYLTDGFGDAPKMPPRFPVLWVLTSDGKEPATWGTKIKLQGSTHNG